MIKRVLVLAGVIGAAAVVSTPAVMAQAAAQQSTAPVVELRVGDMAPDFALEGTDGKTHKLSDYRGKQAVVVAWFPKAYTQGCTIECKSLAANGANIRKFDVAYFMASVDPLEDNKGFAAQEKADFPLLSDPTKATAKAYGVLGRSGVATRWTFYIGKDGKIAHIDKTIRVATSAEDMIAKLGELNVAKK
jgi:peroxiredoxin Q/BCP